MNLDRYANQFGTLIADGQKNKVGLNAAHKYSPERLRVHYNGSRRHIRYGDNANFTDGTDFYELAPATGDTMRIRSAEIFRYVPQYSIKPSFAFEINQSLQAGDKITMAYGDADLANGMVNADGWIVEFVPGLEDHECYYSMYRNGTIQSNGGSRKKISLEKPIQGHRRFALELNWYNVGNSILRETYTQEGFQENINQGHISCDAIKGPTSGNQPLEISFTSGGNGTVVDAGSMALVLLGNPDPKIRTKRADGIETLGTADGTYQPLMGIQNADREVKVNLKDIRILRFTSNDDIDILVQEFASDKVNFGGTDSWTPPNETDEFETAVRVRSDVSGIADSTGTIGGSNGVGGTQRSKARLLSTGGGGGETQSNNLSRSGIKNSLYYADISVVLAKSNTTGDVDFVLDFEEER